MRRKTTAIAALTAALLLAGCAAGKKEITTVDVGNIIEETPSKIVMGSSAGSQGEENVSSLGNTGGDPSNTNSGISIDADITVPQSTEFGTYFVDDKPCSEERAREIKQILFGDADMKFEISKSPAGDIYLWGDTDDLHLTVDSRNSRISIEGYFSVCIKNAFDAPRPGNSNNVDLFEQRDLDFMTREQAIKTVADILDKLDIKVSDDPDIYSLDENGLKAANEATHATKFPSVDKSCECYYIKFNALYGDIPIYNELINFQGEGLMPNPEVTAILSADGLQYLYISDPPGKTELKAPITSMITAEQAANIISEKYSYVENLQVSIDEIKLMYIYDLPNNNEAAEHKGATKMHPAWICRGSAIYYISKEIQELRHEKWESYTLQIDIILDAVTGKEIL